MRQTLQTTVLCGYLHEYRKCPAFGKICSHCKRVEHFVKMCWVKLKHNDIGNNEEGVRLKKDKNNEEFFMVNFLEINKKKVLDRENQIDDQEINVKIDTGAQLNVMPKKMCKEVNNCRERNQILLHISIIAKATGKYKKKEL